jgi:hypothetical protein
MTATTLHRVAIAGALLAMTFIVAASPQQFGTRRIEIPPPDGFVAISTAAPHFNELAQAYIPASNRLVETYTTSADRDAMAGGNGGDLPRYFQVQVLRKLEGTPLSTEEFAQAAAEMEAGLTKAFANLGDKAEEIYAKGNAAIKTQSGSDPNIQVSDFGYLGAFRHEPWGLFFALNTKVTTAMSPKPEQMFCAGTLALINHQLIYLYAYANYHSSADRRWAEAALNAWADAIHAANPDDPALEAGAQRLRGGFNWDRVFFMAGIGAFIGLVYGWLRRRNS